MPATLDLKEEILRLKEERNAVILVHNYQEGPIQDIGDYVGDSTEYNDISICFLSLSS